MIIENDNKDWCDHFQTPVNICKYMASFLPKNAGLILEPTPGKGNLVNALKEYGNVVFPTNNFEHIENGNFD